MRSLKACAMALVSCLALIACGSGGNPQQAGNGNETVTIVHWQHSYQARNKVVEELAKEFQAKYPNVTIQTQFIPFNDYFSKLVTAISSNSGPDVFQVPMEMSEQLIHEGAITAVPSNVLSSKQIADEYVPATVARWKHDGRYYALPTDVETLVLFANADLLKQCGGDPNRLPTTWQDLRAQAQQCTKRDPQGNIVQAGLDTRYKWAIYTQAMYSYIPGAVVDAARCRADFDSPQGIEAWKMATSFETGPGAVDSPKFLTGQHKFEQAKAVFYLNHPVTIGNLKNFPDVHYVVGPPPVPEGSKPVTLMHSWAYVVNKSSRSQTWAWRWANFLSDKAAQIKWFKETGSLPAMKSLIADPSLATDQAHSVALATLASARAVQSVDEKSDDITDDAWDKIVVGHQDIGMVVKDAAKQEDQLIGQVLGCTPGS